MKKRVLIALVVVLLLAMVGAVLPAGASANGSPPNWNIIGVWNGWSYIPVYTFVMNVTTQDADGNFTGTMTYRPYLPIDATVSGKVSGDTLTFTRDDIGSTYWATLSGGVGATSMSGTFIDKNGVTGLWAASGSATFIPRYDNYMQSLAITEWLTPVTAGGTGSVTAEVKANTDVDVHFEFKGHFGWGDYTYASQIVSLTGVDPTVPYYPHATLNVPFKAILDAEVGTTFSYYVYVTLPGDGWSGSAWGVTVSPVVVLPPVTSAEAIEALIAQLKWEVANSALDDGMKTSLMAKLEVANNMVAKGKYKTAYNTLGAFINELQSANAAAVYSGSESWINWVAKAAFIRSLLSF